MNHIGSGQEWDLELGEGGLEFLTPFAMGHNGSYRGKLEALDSAMNFLKISTEEYVVLADSGVLCAINLEKIVEAHAASGADVTIVVKDGICNGQKQLDLAVKVDADDRVTDVAVDYCAGEQYLASMGLFVIRRELLMREVTEAVAHNRYHFERDLRHARLRRTGAEVSAYRYDGVALFNEHDGFFHSSLALIRRRSAMACSPAGPDVYTRSATGACLLRQAFRDRRLRRGRAAACSRAPPSGASCSAASKLGEGASVRNSVIMQRCTIGEGADLECVIMDMDVVVRPEAPCCGTTDHPLVFKRRGRMRIAMVCLEAAPFVKTGGLGDVMQALPNALSS